MRQLRWRARHGEQKVGEHPVVGDVERIANARGNVSHTESQLLSEYPISIESKLPPPEIRLIFQRRHLLHGLGIEEWARL